jgi:hypothetical protein
MTEDFSSAPNINEFLRTVHSSPAYQRVSDMAELAQYIYLKLMVVGIL